MVHYKIKYLLFLFVLPVIGCKHYYELPGLKESGYPEQIGTIILTKCAISGCHNNSSFSASDNLNLTTWNKMFEGSNSGAVAIPYREDFSSICYFTNVDSSLGIVLQPTMPIAQPPLSKAEYLTLRDWIIAGAPSAKGEIKFSDNPGRSKTYITNQLCDVVTVLDAETQLQMRYVDVGNKPGREFPHCIKVAPDKKNWYVSFYVPSDMIQKFDAETDKLIGEIKLGKGTWTSFEITADSKYGYFVDNSNAGKIVYADLQAMQVLATYTFNNKLQYPTGIALNEKTGKIYVGCQYGNYLYRIDIKDPYAPGISELPIDGTQVVKYEPGLDPVELIADGNYCYICCSGSGEIRVMDMMLDKLTGSIDIGASPAYMAMTNNGIMLASCPDDTLSFAGNRGSVAVINTQSYTLIKKINTGYQPYGIAINHQQNMATVVNANISSAGPDSHHSSGCGKKNGNITFIDLATFELIHGIKREMAVYPYAAAAR